MRRRVWPLVGLLGVGVTVAAAPGRAVPINPTVSSVATTSMVRRFPAFDAAGNPKPPVSWRVTNAGGNCCEVFVATTPTGRLLEFGGSYPMYSDDRGLTWFQVRTAAPLLGGEGAISAAPNGDVVGVGWDPYTGDRLQSFKYAAATGRWTYDEIPLHHPFYDRPWIAVVPGPFRRVDGTWAPYATVVRSNYLSTLYDLFYVSYDGVTYTPTTDEPNALQSAESLGYLEPARVPVMDYLQPHPAMRVTPLARGGLLNVAPSRRPARCPSTVFTTDGAWRCLTIPDRKLGTNLHVDSRGWLHEVVPLTDQTFQYSQSADGGRTWRTVDLHVPNDGTVTDPLHMDFKANGALGRAVVAVHADIGEGSQDVVFKLDVSRTAPRLLETMFVGAGDRKTTEGLTSDHRFDFASVALLPDGAIVLAYDDAANADPMLAVQLPG